MLKIKVHEATKPKLKRNFTYTEDQFVADVLELADAEEQEYYREDLEEFARDYFRSDIINVDKVLSDFFD